MWDEITFQALVSSNDKPPDSLIPVIHQRLIAPAKELLLIDQEIDDLEHQLQSIQRECEQVESSISHYRKIIAPLRLLPDDILREIFLQSSLASCSNTPRTIFMPERQYSGPDQFDQPPILLTRVCRRWRDIALTTPQIWSRISFFIPVGIPPIPDGLSFPGVHIQRATLQHSLRSARYDGLPKSVNTWLKRSGATPLSISMMRVNALEGSYGVGVHPEILRGATQLFEDLSSHAHRWQRLHLETNPRDFILFSKHFSVGQLRNLKHLDFCCIPALESGGTSWAQISPLFNDLPSLRSLVWRSLDEVNSPRPYGTRVWNNLTDIQITDYADFCNTVFILECPSLVSCDIIVSDSGDSPSPPSRQLIMPHIQYLSLTLTTFGGYYQWMNASPGSSEVYRIAAPHLRKLKYDTEGEPMSPRRFGNSPRDSFSAFPLGSIIEDAPNLTEISLVVTAAALNEAKRALQLPRVAIEHMEVGSKRAHKTVNERNEAVTTSDMALQGLFQFPEWCSLTSQSTDAELLKIANMDSGSLDQALDSCICPRLKYLEVCGLETVTDDFIFSLVVYRLRLYRHTISRQESGEEGSLSPAGAPTTKYVTPLSLKFHFMKARKDIITDRVARFADFVHAKDIYHLAFLK